MRRSFQNLALAPDETSVTNVLAAQHLRVGYRAADPLVRPWLSAVRERELRDEATEILEECGLQGYANQPVGSLPFGVARLLELVSVFLNEPRLVLLDEPTNGLDAYEREQVSALIDMARRKGTTLLVVAHDMRFIMGITERMYVLSEGRVLFEGSPREVKGHDKVVEVYLGRNP
jgi:ABC-type branched-subunit amino acid transport system ATPase component